MKLNRQLQTLNDMASLSPKQLNSKNDQSQQDIKSSFLKTLRNKKSIQLNFPQNIRKASLLSPKSVLGSFSSSNDLLKILPNKRRKVITFPTSTLTRIKWQRLKQVKSQYSRKLLSNVTNNFIKEQSQSPVPKGFIDPQWMSKTQSKNFLFKPQTPGSLASTELDPMSQYRGQQQEKIQIFLHLGDQKFQYFIDPTKSTSWLELFLIKETKQHQPLLCPVTLVTLDKDLNMDYFLQSRDRPLNVLKNRTLEVKPFCYNQPQNQKKTNICLKDFLFIKCIGVGGFSRVYLVKRLQTGRFFAMKLIDKEFILKNQTEGIVQNERDILAVIDHPFLAKLEYSFEHRNFLVFVLEFCSGGELFQQLKRVKRMTEEQAKYYFAEVCLGIYFLHQLNICYRDVKPENILLDVEGHVRIADFGLSKPNMSDRDIAYSFCGSPEYMAPEMLKKEGHTVAVDNYCLGVLLYELVTGLPPFYSRDINKIYQSILTDQVTFPPNLDLSKEIKDLIVRLLEKNPACRLGSKSGLAEVITHPWFKNLSMTALLEKKIPPPFIPDPFKFNFHIHESVNGTGEIDTIDKLLGRKGLSKDIRVFDQFYFDRNFENQIKIEQAQFFKHYKLILQTLEQRVQIQKRKESKQFLIDTSKCITLARLVPQVPKSPTSITQIMSQQRISPKKFLLPSPNSKNLKKTISNQYFTDRFKAANNSQQMEQFLHGKLSQSINKTLIYNEKLKRRGSSQQKQSKSKNEL